MNNVQSNTVGRDEPKEQFTPGKWITYKNMVMVESKRHNTICTVHIKKPWDELSRPIQDHEAEANRDLVGASKDLYFALKELLEVDYTSGTHLYCAQTRAKQALLKAFPLYKCPINLPITI